MNHVTDRSISQLAYVTRICGEAEREDRPLLERFRYLSIASVQTDDLLRTRLTALTGKKQRYLLKKSINTIRQTERIAKQLRKELKDTPCRFRSWDKLTEKDQAKAIELLDDPEREKRWETAVLTEGALANIPSGKIFFVAHYLEQWLLYTMTSDQPAVYTLHHSQERKLVMSAEGLIPQVLRPPSKKDGKDDDTADHNDADDVALQWRCFRLLRESMACTSWGEHAEDDLRYELQVHAAAPMLLLETNADPEDEAVQHVRILLGLNDEQPTVKVKLCSRADVWQAVAALPDMELYRFDPYEGSNLAIDDEQDLFDVIREHDQLLIHPYNSYQPIIDLLNHAADDANVQSISITLYRVEEKSAIVTALCRAAERGAAVDVLVELRARNEEQRNLKLSETLRSAGCHVFHGASEKRVHGKVMLIVRREDGRTCSYAHLATGNYHEQTVAAYVDVSLLTANKILCSDVEAFFDQLCGRSVSPQYEQLTTAPDSMRAEMLRLIRREMAHAYAKRPCGIRAHMNALTDKTLIAALYDASRAGVPIDLTVRGACCLQPGIDGISEHITVQSIVGRWLEHARIIECINGGETEYYLSSADWMPRNMKRRIELLYPVQQAHCRQQLKRMLDLAQQDNEDAWLLHVDEYTAHRCTVAEKRIAAQRQMMQETTDKE